MKPRRRILLIALALAALVALVFAPGALASAGGGSAGFSGGEGGGSFGGGGGGGRGFALFIVIRLLFDIAILGHGLGLLVLLALFAAWWIMTRGFPSFMRFRESARPAGSRAPS